MFCFCHQSGTGVGTAGGHLAVVGPTVEPPAGRAVDGGAAGGAAGLRGLRPGDAARRRRGGRRPRRPAAAGGAVRPSRRRPADDDEDDDVRPTPGLAPFADARGPF